MNEQKEDICSLIREGGTCFGLNLEEDAVLALQRYFFELRRWSKKINLIGKTQTDRQIIENHFVDSLTLLPFLQDCTTLIDIGSGAGFPGLVCKTVRPDLRLIVVEPRLKRVSFLRHVVRTLALQDVEIFSCRIEELELQKTPSAVVTCRAVAEIGEFLQMIEDVVDHEAEIICMKGPKWQEEMDKAKTYLEKERYIFDKVHEFELPFSHVPRALLFFRKKVMHSPDFLVSHKSLKR